VGSAVRETGPRLSECVTRGGKRTTLDPEESQLPWVVAKWSEHVIQGGGPMTGKMGGQEESKELASVVIEGETMWCGTSRLGGKRKGEWA